MWHSLLMKLMKRLELVLTQTSLMHFFTEKDKLTNKYWTGWKNPLIKVPSRSPPGVRALLSPGQVFLFAVMDTSSRTLSARAPSIPRDRRSTKTKWLSVPPERKRQHYGFWLMCTWNLSASGCKLTDCEIEMIVSFCVFLLWTFLWV